MAATATFSDLTELADRLRPLGVRDGADRGSPHTAYAPLVETPDVEVGLWRSTERGWAVRDRGDTEVVYILSGRARITGDDGTTTEVGPGHLFILPAGWSGRWDVLEPIEKLYVVIPRRQES